MYTIELYKDKSAIDGNGLFAGEFIPKGTIVYFYGSEDSYLSKKAYQSLPQDKREEIHKYGVEDEAGNWVVTDGDVNHSCDANILSLFIDSHYCDIAVKDIQLGDEITLDYGLLYNSSPWNMKCNCGSPLCRKIFGSGININNEVKNLWFSRISDAANCISIVKQNLFYIDDERAKALTEAIKSKMSPMVFSYIKFSLIS